jgi:hypothetical protein
MGSERIEGIDQGLVDEYMAMEDTDWEALNEGRVGTDCKQGFGPWVGCVDTVVGDNIVDSRTESLANCTAAIVDMGNHTAAAVDSVGMVMAIWAMFEEARRQKTSSGQKWLSPAEAEALC